MLSYVPLAAELEAYLHLHIPISEYMGVSALQANDDGVKLGIRLEPNLNHRQTVFGGSESSAAILSAWSLLWIRLRDREPSPRLVIHSSSMEFVGPIDSDFIAFTLPVDPAEWTRFLSSLDRRGKGRLQIRAVVQAGGQICGEFTGTFVALAG